MHRFARRATLAVVALAAIAGAWIVAGPGLAQPEPEQTADGSVGPLSLTQIAGPLAHPWGLAVLPDGRALVTERGGRLVIVDPASGAIVEVAGAPTVYDRNQGGLLDVALAHDFATSAAIYLSYAEAAAGGLSHTAVARARLTDAPALADLEVIFRQSPSLSGGRHFGSRFVVAADGTLFVTLGDRGERGLAQDPTTHVGKIVRIAPDGSVPDDNPFVGLEDVLPEIFSLGHRNPQGFAYDPFFDRLLSISHGARGGDEVNWVRAGANYGWPLISYGTHYSGATIGVGTELPGMEQPLHYWDPSIAPSGALVYEGALFPDWRGDLFVGGLRGELLSRLELTAEGATEVEQLLIGAVGRIRDVAEAPDGAIWLLTDAPDGGLWRLAPAE